MRAALVLLCVAAIAFTQQKEGFGQDPGQGGVASACGPAGVSYKVSMDRSQHGSVPPVAGKALVYFIHDSGGPSGDSMAYPTTKYAVDGVWVGANHGDSWFGVPVAPGEHHVCATLQSSFVDQRVELAHFNAEAGKTYFFRTQLITSRSVELLGLDRVDSDEGEYLIALYPLVVSHPRK